MTESMLNSLMRLFAIIASINHNVISTLSRNFVESYLSQQFSPRLAEKFLKVFDENLEEFNTTPSKHNSKRTAALSVKLLTICEKINKELHVKNKYLILFSLIQFTKHFEAYTYSEEGFTQTIADTVKTIADGLLIDLEDFENCWYFITDQFFKVPSKDKVLIASDSSSFSSKSINHLRIKKLHGQIFFLKISQADIFIYYYKGEDKLESQNKYIFPRSIYILSKGTAIRGKKIQPIYYSDIIKSFLKKEKYNKIYFQALDIEYKFRKDAIGIRKLSFPTESGQLVGIMGGSGTGKSTLLKVLNGSFKPTNGQGLINGYNIHENSEAIEGVMGYVPQDDLLIGELTVYQNLLYNAKLCFGNMEEEKIQKLISKTLTDLDLFQVKDLQVGTPLNRNISGGQRKRLNIAQELIREPYILFVDEPTSGLSSTDSENVMQLLKEQTLHGKLVFVIIHQPSSDLFKLFDKLLILDKGGHPVYFGNPLEAITYLKDIATRVDASERVCDMCGNIHTDDILQMIELKKVNEFGEYEQKRQITPEDWYELYQKNIQPQLKIHTKESRIPKNLFNKPGKISQFFTFSTRNFLSKIANTQYLLLAFLVPPVLALILGYFTKYTSGTDLNPTEYIFSRNVNLPAYIFMTVIVSLFIGMIVSAEEIIKDRKILERESFLNLSRTSYLNSKILFLFLLSAIQMSVFVILGNSILQVKGLNFSYWLVLFSTSCLAVMIGLIISANLKSVIAIYINIPFILVPFILLSGVIVKYDKLHYNVSSSEYVPFIGDMMPSRWAYEALMVNQFKNNKYEKHFFEIDKKIGNLRYKLDYLIPELYNKLDDAQRSFNEGELKVAENNLKILSNAFVDLSNELKPRKDLTFSANSLSKNEINNATNYLNRLKFFLSKKINLLNINKDEIIEDLKVDGLSMEDIVKLKQVYHNSRVADLVLNTNDLRKVKEDRDRLIQLAVPIYKEPTSKYGRAQFFAGVKKLGNLEIDTLTFNLLTIWLMVILLYYILVTDIIKKTADFINKRINKPV